MVLPVNRPLPTAASRLPDHSPRMNAEEQSRTVDTRIFSPLLYHLSYLGTGEI